MDIELIRAEIKKLQDIFVETAQGMETEDDATVYSMCAVEFGDEILSFLDTIEEPVSEDLKEAADDHIRKVADAAGHPGWDWETQDIAEAFKAGAEWQKKHMTVTIKQSDLVGISKLKRDEHLY